TSLRSAGERRAPTARSWRTRRSRADTRGATVREAHPDVVMREGEAIPLPRCFRAVRKRSVSMTNLESQGQGHTELTSAALSNSVLPTAYDRRAQMRDDEVTDLMHEMVNAEAHLSDPDLEQFVPARLHSWAALEPQRA